MKIIIIGGFLGAGKTSLIGHIVEAYIAQGIKVAIIENEISPSGVDATYLEREGIIVRELAAGCICCRLKSDLQTALKQLESEFSPNVILIEPSGAAIPEQVIDGLNISHREPPLTVIVIDLARFNSLGIKQYPFIEQSIKAADIVLLNKCDTVDRKIKEQANRAIIKVNPDAKCFSVSLKEDNNLKPVLIQLEKTGKRSTIRLSSPASYAHPVAATRELALKEKNINQIIQLLEQLLHDLKNSGCTLIGHVKATITVEHKKQLFLSATAFNQPIEISPPGCDISAGSVLKLNVVIYGIRQQVLDSILARTFPL